MNLLEEQEKPFLTDVAQHVGTYCGQSDGFKWWEVKDNQAGPFAGMLEQVQQELSSCASIDRCRLILVDLFLRGRSIETIVACVMIGGTTRMQREKAVKLLQQSSLIEKYPGLNIDQWESPPHVPNIIMAGEKSEPADDSHIYQNSDFSLCEVAPTITDGETLLSIHTKDETGQKLQSGTVSCLMSVRGRKFLFSPAHIFLPLPPEEENESEFSDDSSSDSDFELDLMQSRSVTPAYLRSGSDGTASDVVLPDISPPTSPYNLHEPILDRQNIEIFSINVDYALLSVPQGLNLTEQLSEISSEMVAKVKNAEVSFTTPNNGTITGWLSGRPTTMSLPHTHKFVNVYPFQCFGPVVRGDCGSMVSDKKSDNVFGFIVATSVEGRVAYIVSADDIFSDIENKITDHRVPQTETQLPHFAPPHSHGSTVTVFSDLQTTALSVTDQPPNEYNAFHAHITDKYESGITCQGQSRSFVPYSVLYKHWTPKRIKELLRAADIYELPPSMIRDRFLLVFSILAFNSDIKLLPRLVSESQDDGHLPWKHIPGPVQDEFNINQLRRFFDSQWIFCPRLIVGLAGDLNLHRDTILAFKATESTEQGQGRERNVHVREVLQRAHNHLGYPLPKYVVIKSFPPHLHQEYFNERRSYNTISHGTFNIPRLMGSYSWLSEQNERTGNIILEYAEHGSLLDLFEKQSPPYKPDEISSFWTGIAGIVKGVEFIHASTGFHFDLQPANIVLSSGGEPLNKFSFIFKIIDFEFSHVAPQDLGPNGSKIARAFVRKNPKTYVPPELVLGDEINYNVGSEVDLWSLGCIIVECAVWISLGERGRLDFIEDRMRETGVLSDYTKSGREDYFHDGTGVLRCVREFGHHIRDRGRREDKTTSRMFDLAIKKLLVEKDKRQSARHIYLAMKSIIESPAAFPRIEIDHVSKWIERKKIDGNTPELRGWENVQAQLGGRDFIFVIDNCETMQVYEDQVRNFVQCLAYLVKRLSPDGAEIMCTSDPMTRSKFKHARGHSNFVTENFSRGKGGHCNMELVLEKALDPIGDYLQNSASKSNNKRTSWWSLPGILIGRKKPVTVIVFTDGIWGSSTGGGAENPIQAIISKMRDCGANRSTVAIQFLRFGSNPVGERRLQFLDDDLAKKDRNSGLNIVDTKPVTESIWDILIGAVDEHVDGHP